MLEDAFNKKLDFSEEPKKEYVKSDVQMNKGDGTKRISVVLAIPHTGWITAGLETKIAHWIMESDYDVRQMLSSVKPTVSNRNIIAKTFLDSGADFLLTIDSDTVPTKNPLDLVKHNVDIVGGVYPAWKNDNYLWLACWLDKDGSYKQYLKAQRQGLKEVDALGTGCMCIKREVIQNISMPFVDKIREGVGDRELGHDLYFCKRAKELGYKVYADWDMVCDHVKEMPLIPIVNAINRAYQDGYRAGRNEV
jgi:hypothetical protein